jgi:hypothetical protein
VTVPIRNQFDDLDRELASVVERFARELRGKFPDEIESAPRAFKRRVIRSLRAALPPGPGRPCAAAVSLAVQMRAQGSSWSVIYAMCIPSTLARDSRQLAQLRLRSAVRARRRRLPRVP